MKNAGIKTLLFKILIFTISAGIFASCKDDETETSGGYYVRFNANGQKVEFKVQGATVAAFGQATNIYNAVFTGYDASSNVILQVFDKKEITTSTYSGYTLSGASFIGALISYQDDSGTLFRQEVLNPVTSVTISEITSETVKGTFSGIVKASGKPNISITQGEFYVWRSN
jgi:hypothetical protein